MGACAKLAKGIVDFCVLSGTLLFAMNIHHLELF